MASKIAEVKPSLSQDILEFDEDSRGNLSQDSKVDASREDITESSGEWEESEESQFATEFPEKENGSSDVMDISSMRICDENERDLMRELSIYYQHNKGHDDDDSSESILFEHNPSEEDSDKNSHEDDNLVSEQQSLKDGSGEFVGAPTLPNVDVKTGSLVVSSETRSTSHPQLKEKKHGQMDDIVPVGEEGCVLHPMNTGPVLHSSEDSNTVVANSSSVPIVTDESSTPTVPSSSQKEHSGEAIIPGSATRDRSSQLGFPSNSSDMQTGNCELRKIYSRAEDSRTYSTNGHHTPRHIDCPSASTDKIGKPPTHQSGSSELVIAQGGGKLRDIKEGTEDHSTDNHSPEVDEDELIKTNVAAVYQHHKEKTEPPSNASDSVHQQPTNGNYNEKEMLSEVYFSVLCVLEAVSKILPKTPHVWDTHKQKLQFFCEKFLEDFPAERKDLPSPEQLVGMRNAAAHTNAEYRMNLNKIYGTPKVVMYEKKGDPKRYRLVYECSPDKLSDICFKLRALFLDWKPVEKYLEVSLQASSNSREDEVVSLAEEESQSTNGNKN